MINTKKIDYRIQRQSARQWRSLLAATAHGLCKQFELKNPKIVMHSIGIQFGSQTPLPECETIADLQAAMCSVWQDMDWGRVELEENDGVLNIIHHGSTNGNLLNTAYGMETPLWVTGFLEGTYQKWLSGMGAGDTLRVRQISATDEFGSTEFQLSA
ncbi:MAG: cellulose biosynthesis protein BcsD [Polynucleobacter sp.]|jgi:hypothetical protein